MMLFGVCRNFEVSATEITEVMTYFCALRTAVETNACRFIVRDKENVTAQIAELTRFISFIINTFPVYFSFDIFAFILNHPILKTYASKLTNKYP